MRESKGLRVLVFSRTLFMLFGIAACYMRLINVDWFTQASVFVMAPWAIAIITGELFYRQIRMCPYNILLFAMSCIFLLSSLYNRGILVAGLAVFVCFCTLITLIYHVCRDTGNAIRDRRRRILCLIAAALNLAVFLPLFVSFYNGHGWRFPWRSSGTEQATTNMQAMLAFAYSRSWMLNDLSVLVFVCSALLVAGIVPNGIDTAHLKRESRILCGFIITLSCLLLVPAVYSVFIGEPIQIAGLPEALGISRVGGFSDRLRALQHPNATAHCALLGLFCIVYCMYGHRRWGIKAVLSLISLCFLLALTHCQSRTTNITLGLGLGALAFRGILPRVKSKWISVPSGLLAAALLVPLTVVSINALYSADLKITLRRNTTVAAQETEVTLESTAEPVNEIEPASTPSAGKITLSEDESSQMLVSRTVSEGLVDLFSTHRDVIWQQSIVYLLRHPREMLLGMGAGRIVDRIGKYTRTYTKWWLDPYHLHNSFLEALARGGIFMLLCLIAALVLLVVPTARLLTARNPIDPGCFVFAVFIGMPLTLAMTEALLFTDISLFNLVFFYSASRAVKYSADLKARIAETEAARR